VASETLTTNAALVGEAGKASAAANKLRGRLKFDAAGGKKNDRR
jgi:hypothetical protein